MKQLFAFLLLAIPLAQARAECPQGLVPIALDQEHWKVAYDGYGQVDFAGGEIQMSPARAKSASSTHASLLLSKLQLEAGSFDFYVEYANLHQLREGPPNPWEVFWILFPYRSQVSKITNYLIIKTNGLELGKAYGEVDQQFLFTQSTPQANFNRWHTLRLIRRGDHLQGFYDQEKVLDWHGPLENHAGAIGLYTEDAAVKVRSVCTKATVREVIN